MAKPARQRTKPDIDGGTREPLVEGIFYPSRVERLRELLSRESRTDEAEGKGAADKRIEGKVDALLVPHASYELTLPYLKESFAALYSSLGENRPDYLILLAGIHREKAPALFLPPHRAFASALAELPVHTGLVRAVEGRFDKIGRAHV